MTASKHPRPSQRLPKYRRQTRPGDAPDRAFVVLDGHRHYLGPYDSAESRQRYERLIAEWLTGGRRLPLPPERMSVKNLVAAFWRHAERHYRRPDGTHTTEIDNYRQALRPLTALYGDTHAAAFGPRALRAVRQRMIRAGWCRTHVNKQIGRLRHVFRWGVEHEIVPPAVHTALCTVAGLQRGRTEARERDPITPVLPTHVEAIERYVSRQVWGLVQLQLLTGARAGELLKLRSVDIDMTADVWTATVTQHKTAHHGRERRLYFGPQAQTVLREFIAGRSVDAFMFSPREANAELKAADATTRRRRGQAESPRKTDRTIGGHYTTPSYRRAIQRACRAAGVPVWSPHQLRHNAATAVRRQFGVEAAQIILGHARADVTQLYAEVNERKALRVAARIG